MNAVTCLTWIPRGVAKAHPDQVRLPEDELENLMDSAGRSAETESDEVDSGDENPRKKSASGVADELKNSVESRYSLDGYDDDDDAESKDVGLSITGLSVYPSNQHDPYLSKDSQSSDDESDLSITADDSLIALCKVHGEFFSLEVWVTNVADGSLYCHHDTILSSCPLAIEWVGYDPGETGSASAANLVAIGNMTPTIELWDLDVVNTLEPAFSLKGKRKRKKKEKSSKKIETSRGHADAVLALSWNRNRRQILASASADWSVGVWDLSRGKVVSFLTDHSDKVQAVHWHPVEDQLLVSGCYDGCVRLFDCRASSSAASRHWSLGGEVEKVLWDHHDPFYLFAGTDIGSLSCIDVRSSSPVFTHEAHSSALSAVALSPSVSGCLVTASSDRSVKVWDISGHSSPQLVRRRLCKIGEIHCAAACPDEPLLFCVGGEFEMKLLNFHNDETIVEKFGVSNTDIVDETVASPNSSDSKLNSDKPVAVTELRRSKITSSDFSPDNANAVSESSKSDGTGGKRQKKLKQSLVEPKPSGSEVKKSVKSKHFKNKHIENAEAQS